MSVTAIATASFGFPSSKIRASTPLYLGPIYCAHSSLPHQSNSSAICGLDLPRHSQAPSDVNRLPVSRKRSTNSVPSALRCALFKWGFKGNISHSRSWSIRSGSGTRAVGRIKAAAAAAGEVQERDCIMSTYPDTDHEPQSREKKGARVGAVFFDMDDTLVLTHEVDTQAQKVVMQIVGERAPHVDQSAVLDDFLKQFHSQAWDPEHKVDVTEWRARMWNRGLEAQGVNDMDLAREMQDRFDSERMRGFRWTTRVEELVRNLHRQGIKMGIITNGHAKVQRAKLEACNADKLFDTIIVGGEEPHQKPHRDLFLKACNLAGTAPEESVMVGDNLKTDVQGGINAGFLATVWVNVHTKELPSDGPQPDHVISTFAELQQILSQLGVHFDAD